MNTQCGIEKLEKKIFTLEQKVRKETDSATFQMTYTLFTFLFDRVLYFILSHLVLQYTTASAPSAVAIAGALLALVLAAAFFAVLPSVTVTAST